MLNRHNLDPFARGAIGNFTLQIRVFPVRNISKVCGNIGLHGRLLRVIATQKTYYKPQPD